LPLIDLMVRVIYDDAFDSVMLRHGWLVDTSKQSAWIVKRANSLNKSRYDQEYWIVLAVVLLKTTKR
jgi:hypothetical protein